MPTEVELKRIYNLPVLSGALADTDRIPFDEDAGSGNFDTKYFTPLQMRTYCLATLGTAASLNVPASGDAAANEVVKGNDTRLVSVASNGLIARTGVGAYAARTLTAGPGIGVTNGTGVSGNPTVSLDITSLAEDTLPDSVADFVVTYDASASAYKKVLLQNVAGASASSNLLSGLHIDTTPASVVRGDLITGQGASPKWTRLALGAAGRYVRSDGTDAAWSEIQFADLPEFITPLTEETSVAAGDLLAIYDVSAGALRKMTRANLVAGLSASFTVREVDGTPSLSATTLEFQQAVGFVVTDETGGVGRVTLSGVPDSALATISTAGKVNDSALSANVTLGGNTFIGTGAIVRETSPTLITPTLGVATATSINGLTITSSTGTLTITNAKTASFSNTLTFTGTDGSTVACGAGGTVVYEATAQTLTNKTLTTPILTVLDSQFTVQDNADPTKQAQVQASGITAGQTRTITLPDSNTTLPIASQVLTFSGPTAARSYTLPDAADTLAALGTIQTWTANQTFGSGILRATSARLTTDVSDANGNEVFKITATGSAVNEFTVINAATGSSPELSATGGDTNIGQKFTTKGTGDVYINQPSNGARLIIGRDAVTAKGAFQSFVVGSETLVFFGANGCADTGGSFIRFNTSQIGWVLEFDPRGGNDRFQLVKIDAAGSTTFPSEINGTGVYGLMSGGQIAWSSSATDARSTKDTGIARYSAGTVRITNGSTGGGNLLVGPSTAGLGATLGVLPDSALTNSIGNITKFGINSTGTPAAGFGGRANYSIETTTTIDTQAADMEWTWVDATHASRKARFVFNIYDTAAREAMRMEASGTAAMLGFFGATAVARPSAYTQTYSTADKTHANFTSADLATTAATQTTPWGFASQAQAENIATQFNLLRADVADLKQLVNALIDDAQALGLVG